MSGPEPEDPAPVEALLPDLASPDAFVRLAAVRRLVALVRGDFGFPWDGTDARRAAALDRIRAWCEERRRRIRERERARRTAEMSSLDLSALKALPPEKVQQHLKALLAKAQLAAALGLGRPRCEGCRAAPATVEVVVPGEGSVEVTHLCETCAVERGDFR